MNDPIRIEPQPPSPSSQQRALPPPGAGPGSTGLAERYNPWAIASLVAGILTWFSAPFFHLVLPTPLCTLAAIVCGHVARSQLRREPGQQGNWMAVVGLVLGWGMVLTLVLIALVVVLVFGGIAAFLAYLGH
jgi:hypothetical protein